MNVFIVTSCGSTEAYSTARKAIEANQGDENYVDETPVIQGPQGYVFGKEKFIPVQGNVERLISILNKRGYLTINTPGCEDSTLIDKREVL